jgi:hypothetical protein
MEMNILNQNNYWFHIPNNHPSERCCSTNQTKSLLVQLQVVNFQPDRQFSKLCNMEVPNHSMRSETIHQKVHHLDITRDKASVSQITRLIIISKQGTSRRFPDNEFRLPMILSKVNSLGVLIVVKKNDAN